MDWAPGTVVECIYDFGTVSLMSCVTMLPKLGARYHVDKMIMTRGGPGVLLVELVNSPCACQGDGMPVAFDATAFRPVVESSEKSKATVAEIMRKALKVPELETMEFDIAGDLRRMFAERYGR